MDDWPKPFYAWFEKNTSKINAAAVRVADPDVAAEAIVVVLGRLASLPHHRQNITFNAAGEARYRDGELLNYFIAAVRTEAGKLGKGQSVVALSNADLAGIPARQADFPCLEWEDRIRVARPCIEECLATHPLAGGAVVQGILDNIPPECDAARQAAGLLAPPSVLEDLSGQSRQKQVAELRRGTTRVARCLVDRGLHPEEYL